MAPPDQNELPSSPGKHSPELARRMLLLAEPKWFLNYFFFCNAKESNIEYIFAFRQYLESKAHKPDSSETYDLQVFLWVSVERRTHLTTINHLDQSSPEQQCIPTKVK